MHDTKRPHAASHILLSLLAFLAILSWSSAIQAQTLPQPVFTPQPLLPEQRLSIERGAADLGAATEQTLLAAVFYLTSAATLITGVAPAGVLFAEFNPVHPGSRFETAELAMLGTAVGSFVVHAITTALAIKVGVAAQRRHQRAQDALLLTHVAITPFGAVLSGTF